MEYALTAEKLTYQYPSAEENTLSLPVFENLNLQIQQGSFVAILGRNGCGKSTLAKHFNAVLLPSGGKMYVYGMDTEQEQCILDVRRSVGMVFQNPDNQIVSNVVEEDVAFAPENLGVAPAEIRMRVDEALKTVDMYNYRDRAPHLLSGGQKQRVAIAGVIAMQPQCIVLDEPTAMLDPQGRNDVLDTICRLNQEKGVTVVLITHHMREAAQADRVVVMAEDGIRADGTPEQVFSQVELMHELGLGVPDTVQLLYDLQQRGFELPLNAISSGACAQVLAEFLKA